MSQSEWDEFWADENLIQIEQEAEAYERFYQSEQIRLRAETQPTPEEGQK